MVHETNLFIMTSRASQLIILDLTAEKMNTLLLCVCLLPAALAAVDLSSYPLSQKLRDGYTLHWSFNVEEQNIRFAVNVSTTGWVGLGLSPTGGMPNSDIVIGWVNDQGQAFLNVSPCTLH